MTGSGSLPPWAVVRPDRLAHIQRVADLVRHWADARGVSSGEAERWQRAVWLHDALRDAAPEVLGRHAPQGDWPAQLWHGPAAAAAARAAGESDVGVLDAVRFHSVGYAGWDDCGRVLFLGDYLEPGRIHDRADLAALASRVPAELPRVLRDVTARRLTWLAGAARPIRRETWELWNSLVAGA